MTLTDKEASILLGATLMHWGVPFHAVPRRKLTDHQQTIVDEASEMLIGIRESSRQSQGQEALEVGLSDEAIGLLIAVVEDCLNECGMDVTELRLQLKTSESQEVEALLERMRRSLETPYAKRG